MIDYIIVGIITALLVFAAYRMVKRRKEGKGCAGCSGCSQKEPNACSECGRDKNNDE